MRILLIGINFFPESTSTGKYSGELAAYLAARGHQVHVITAPPYYPYWKIQPDYKGWLYKKETWQGVEIQRCPLWVPRKPTGITRLIHLASFTISTIPALAAQIAWKPDVILSVAPTIMNAPFVLATARLSGSKTWLHIQDFELDAGMRLGMLPGGRFLSKIMGTLERSLLNGFQHVSTISNRMLSHLRSKGIPEERTSLLPNWVDTKSIFPLNDEPNLLRERLGFNPDQTVVLYAGNLGKKQGLENLLVAARQLSAKQKIQFVLCGEGAIREELQAAARDLPNVHFLPIQPVENLNQLLNMADIHVMLQKADAADLVMPSKLSGMLASGKAVIATAIPHTEVGQVVQRVGTLIPPDDPQSLTEAIDKLSDAGEERASSGKKGREFAVCNWDSAHVLESFEKNFQRMMV